ncbi:hypothetical protein KI655_21545 [Vibrio sp. D404a]|uniref:hypothetical protein n=1 Tax=unclassified Vibrio TaxID=2614977 RepID=UPI00255286FD|nr:MULTISPECIES: hypothetical protein [unclassified Vibrio]MDK9739884.1 hypothetical protein [Vibrio sp. D404a]MDK9799212.1 hypothetical protein [Vibrio sp. D449a]
MKIYEILLAVLILFIGGCFGLWLGVETVYVEVEEVPTKTIFDLGGFIATIISAVVTVLGFILAIHVYKSWHSQQLDQSIIGVKLDIIKNISILDRTLSKHILLAGENDLNDQLDKCIIELNDTIKLFYTLDTSSRNNLSVSECMVYDIDDFLRPAKRFKSLASDYARLAKSGEIVCSRQSIAVNSTLMLDTSLQFFRIAFNGGLTGTPMELYITTAKLGESAMIDVRNAV